MTKIVTLNEPILTEKDWLCLCNGCDKIQDIRDHGQECCEGYSFRFERKQQGEQTK